MAILAVIALTYFTTDELGGSAYLAAFLMGLIVGNSEHLRLGDAHEHTRRLGEFMEDISELCVLAVFVTLGINLPLQAVWDNLWGGLVVMAAFLLIARPVTVLACMLPDRRGAWTREELVFLSWSRETGVVPAAIAGVLLARGRRRGRARVGDGGARGRGHAAPAGDDRGRACAPAAGSSTTPSRRKSRQLGSAS